MWKANLKLSISHPLCLEGAAEGRSAQEIPHPLSPPRPVWIRSTSIESGGHQPHYATASVWHPYCEINFTHLGRAQQFVGLESIECIEGNVLMIGPGTPHQSLHFSEPYRSTAIFFLPFLILELGPCGDGAHLLSRCFAAKTVSEQMLRPPATLRNRLEELFEAITRELGNMVEGSELKVRSILVDILVSLARWKKTKDDDGKPSLRAAKWLQLQKPLQLVHQRYAEAIYIKDLAAASGMSVLNLQQLFQDTIGLSCMQYIQRHRITRAMAMLSARDVRIIQVANEVGFQTLSHFNASFRKFVGISPSDFMRMRLNPKAQAGASSPRNREAVSLPI